jgi:hypothetical protein
VSSVRPGSGSHRATTSANSRAGPTRLRGPARTHACPPGCRRRPPAPRRRRRPGGDGVRAGRARARPHRSAHERVRSVGSALRSATARPRSSTPSTPRACSSTWSRRGTLRRHPQLKLIASHGGGTVPFLAERIAGISPEALRQRRAVHAGGVDPAIDGSTRRVLRRGRPRRAVRRQRPRGSPTSEGLVCMTLRGHAAGPHLARRPIPSCIRSLPTMSLPS